MYVTFILHHARVTTCRSLLRWVSSELVEGRDEERCSGVFDPADLLQFDMVTDFDVVR
jgi:hypothetical protein